MDDTELYAPEAEAFETEQGYIYIDNVGMEPVTFELCRELALYEGDIILGTVDTMRRMRALVDCYANRTDDKEQYDNMIVSACAINTTGKWWKMAAIPFKIDSTKMSVTIKDAIEYIHKHTPLRLIPRTNETDYVAFVDGAGCSSYVGKQGGRQEITIANWARRGNVVHEVFHAAGLWHEHSRADRDTYVTYNDANVKNPAKNHNFNKHTTDGRNLGKYDYDSIMHYSESAFASPGTKTLVPKVSGVKIGQRDHASVSDILGLVYMRAKA